MDRDARNALIRAHQNNINRYCRLLATNLTEVERAYVHKRIAEENGELEKLLKPPGRAELWPTSKRRRPGFTQAETGLTEQQPVSQQAAADSCRGVPVG